MIWLVIVLLILSFALYYIYRTAYLKKGVRYFVSAIIMRNNEWYIKEGRKKLGIPYEKRINQTDDTFWQQGADCTLASADDLLLTARVFDQCAKTWVICLHGYRSDGHADCQGPAEKFWQAGYNVLVPDLRAHGQSEGNEIGLGWLDRLDLLLWIDKVLEKDNQCRIYLYGLGMGAATLLLASGEVMPAQVAGLIADSSYTSVYSGIRSSLPQFSRLPIKRFLRIANRYSKQLVGYPFLQISVTRQIGSNHLPVLFLHGESDSFLAVSESNTLMEATAGEKQQIIFPGMGHLQAVTDAPEYWPKVLDFVNRQQQQTMSDRKDVENGDQRRK
ncbi:alpha/beta hydrolase [Enterococcus sp.]|uniref:alpha/beta hydrolase n=1 Tax=Enterococcus sp. TaxID=35783 RepID=UPI0028ADD9FC|nr:alpha/beta hydrolase [Enterococcus sp.]